MQDLAGIRQYQGLRVVLVLREVDARGIQIAEVGPADHVLGDAGGQGDIDAAAKALRELAEDPERRRAQGARSRELARDWGYGPSVEGFLEAVREAVGDRS